ncbi:MAG: response regulator [Candidatus Hydrogenedentota bacterium]|nr:MAG: response regulator [Candidatus Hydrogenedentota bacterium]
MENTQSKILVVDDEKIIVDLHKKLLERNGYRVIVAYNGLEALRKVSAEKPDLILTDVFMPEMDGLQLCEQLKKGEHTNLIPIIMVTAVDDFDNKIRGIETGADDYLTKPVRSRELYARVKSLLRIKTLTDNLERAETVIFSLANAIEAKDRFTKGHIERVSLLAVSLGRHIGLSREEISTLEKGGAIHDIGKIGIRDTILNKPGKLTDEEFEEIKKHPLTGERICRPLHSLKPVLPLIRHHHERYDGSGYPSGLSGENIPLFARIMAIVDVYDALTSQRAYRDAMSHAEAMRILRKETADRKFDPVLFEKFEEVVEMREDLRKPFGDEREAMKTA